MIILLIIERCSLIEPTLVYCFLQEKQQMTNLLTTLIVFPFSSSILRYSDYGLQWYRSSWDFVKEPKTTTITDKQVFRRYFIRLTSKCNSRPALM